MLSLTSSLGNGFLQLDSSITFSNDFCKGMNLHFLISAEEIDSKFFLNKMLLLILGGSSYMRYSKENYFSVSIYDKKLVYKNIKKIENIQGASYYEQLQSAFKKHIKPSARRTNLYESLKEYYEKYIIGNKNIKKSKNIIIIVKKFTSDDLSEYHENLNRYIKEIRSKDVGIYFFSDDSIYSKNIILNISESGYNMEVQYPIAHFVSESYRANDLFGVKKFCYQLLHGATCKSYNEWSEWSGPCEFERRQRIIPLKITNIESTNFRSHYDPSCRNVFDYSMSIKEDFRVNCKNSIYECRGICDKGYKFKPYAKSNEIVESYEECNDLPPCTRDQRKNGDHTLYADVILNSLLSESSIQQIRDRDDRALIEKDMPGDTEEMSNERRIKDMHLFLDNKMKYMIDKQHKLIEQLQKDIQDRKNKKDGIIEDKKKEVEEKKEQVEEKKEEMEEKKEQVEEKENQEQKENTNLQETKTINESPIIDMKNNENTLQHTQKEEEIKRTRKPIDNFENDGTNKLHVINTGNTNTQSSPKDLDGDHYPNKQNVLNNELNKLEDQNEKDNANVFSIPINGENIKKKDIYEHPKGVESAEDVHIIHNPTDQSIENGNNIINMNNKSGSENSSKNMNSETHNISDPFNLKHLKKNNDHDGSSEANGNTSSYNDKKEDVEINLERKVVEQTNEHKETGQSDLNHEKKEESIYINKENKEGDIIRNNGENVEIHLGNNRKKIVDLKKEDIEKNVNVKHLSVDDYGYELEGKRIIGANKNEDKEIENKNAEGKKIVDKEIENEFVGGKQSGTKEIENELIGGKQIEDKKISGEQNQGEYVKGEKDNGVHVKVQHIDGQHIEDHDNEDHHIKDHQTGGKQGTDEKNEYNNTQDSSLTYGKDKDEEFTTESSNINYTPYIKKNNLSLKTDKIYEPHVVEEINEEDKLSKEKTERFSNNQEIIRKYEQENHKINEHEEEEPDKIKYKNLNIEPQVGHKIREKNIDDDVEKKKYEFTNTEETYKNNEKNHNLIGKNEVSDETMNEYIISPKSEIINEQKNTPQYEEVLSKNINNDKDNGKRINNNDQLESPILSNEKKTDDIHIIEEKEKIDKPIHNNDLENQNHEKKHIQDDKLEEYSTLPNSKEMKNISGDNIENNLLSNKKEENHKIIHENIEEDTTSKDNEKNMQNYIIHDDLGKKDISRENTGEDISPNKYLKNKENYGILDDKGKIKIYEENNEEYVTDVGSGENKVSEGNSNDNIMPEEYGKNKNSQENSEDNIMTEKNGKNKSSEENTDDNIMTEKNGKDKFMTEKNGKNKSSEENADDNIIREENGKNKSSQENSEDNIMTEKNGKNNNSQENSDDNIMTEEYGENKNSHENSEDNIMTEEYGKNKSPQENIDDNIIPEKNGENKNSQQNSDHNIMTEEYEKNKNSQENIDDNIMTEKNGGNKNSQENTDDNIMTEGYGKNKNSEKNKEEDIASYEIDKNRISHENDQEHFTPYESRINKEFHTNVDYNIVSGDNEEKGISVKNISEDIIPDGKGKNIQDDIILEENGENKNFEENIEEDKISDKTQKSKISHENAEGHFTPYESGKNKISDENDVEYNISDINTNKDQEEVESKRIFETNDNINKHISSSDNNKINKMKQNNILINESQDKNIDVHNKLDKILKNEHVTSDESLEKIKEENGNTRKNKGSINNEEKIEEEKENVKNDETIIGKKEENTESDDLKIQKISNENINKNILYTDNYNKDKSYNAQGGTHGENDETTNGTNISNDGLDKNVKIDQYISKGENILQENKEDIIPSVTINNSLGDKYVKENLSPEDIKKMEVAHKNIQNITSEDELGTQKKDNERNKEDKSPNGVEENHQENDKIIGEVNLSNMNMNESNIGNSDTINQHLLNEGKNIHHKGNVNSETNEMTNNSGTQNIISNEQFEKNIIRGDDIKDKMNENVKIEDETGNNIKINKYNDNAKILNELIIKNQGTQDSDADDISTNGSDKMDQIENKNENIHKINNVNVEKDKISNDKEDNIVPPEHKEHDIISDNKKKEFDNVLEIPIKGHNILDDKETITEQVEEKSIGQDKSMENNNVSTNDGKDIHIQEEDIKGNIINNVNDKHSESKKNNLHIDEPNKYVEEKEIKKHEIADHDIKKEFKEIQENDSNKNEPSNENILVDVNAQDDKNISKLTNDLHDQEKGTNNDSVVEHNVSDKTIGKHKFKNEKIGDIESFETNINENNEKIVDSINGNGIRQKIVQNENKNNLNNQDNKEYNEHITIPNEKIQESGYINYKKENEKDVQNQFNGNEQISSNVSQTEGERKENYIIDGENHNSTDQINNIKMEGDISSNEEHKKINSNFNDEKEIKNNTREIPIMEHNFNTNMDSVNDDKIKEEMSHIKNMEYVVDSFDKIDNAPNEQNIIDHNGKHSVIKGEIKEDTKHEKENAKQMNEEIKNVKEQEIEHERKNETKEEKEQSIKEGKNKEFEEGRNKEFEEGRNKEFEKNKMTKNLMKK
ncbi:hypothetical protein PFUGPA_03947 [Plasmodium falciparum Palo Alto/Uganda]|uniref:TRAP-like protein n=1 Tax=Plasmodium falciparum (isolate Palo Alto / Uganda) TaxID=57270 RepID=W4IXJ6_PLAFP|nr:hypothetical protein PFUGPA_03947 [Plasmodium falciparum Palo Alto/Uganda]